MKILVKLVVGLFAFLGVMGWIAFLVLYYVQILCMLIFFIFLHLWDGRVSLKIHV